MNPLLSREEVSALLHETKNSSRESTKQLIIELGNHCLVLRDLSNLEQDVSIELNMSLNKPYLLRSKDHAIAIGVLSVLDGKLFVKITQLVNGDNRSILE
jgi:flagellar motor switch/type III secretory pathway protein FliN